MILVHSTVSKFLKNNTLTCCTVLKTDEVWMRCSFDVCWDVFASLLAISNNS